MRKGVYLYIISVLTVVLAACSDAGNRGNGYEAQPSDTIYTADAVMNIYGHDSERALEIIDSGVLVGNIEPDRATLLRATVYCKSSDEWPLDTAYQMLERLMESDFVNKEPDNRWNVLDLLVGISRRRGDNVAYLRWATEKADYCRLQGEETEALRTEAEIGAVLTRMGEVEKGLSKLDGVIGALDNQSHFNELDACIIALKRKIGVLSELDRPSEMIPLANRMIEKINDFREHPNDYDDGSYRLPPNETERQGYCDFYTSQAYSYLTIAYGDCWECGRPRPRQYQDSARHYLALFERSDYAKTLNGRMILSSAYLRLGQYSKVLPIYDEVEDRLGDDTLNSNYVTILKGCAVMAEAAGNYYAANSYLRRYGELRDILNKQLLESRAHEYAARYHLQEEQMKVEAERQKAQNSRRVAIIHLVLALLAILAAVWLLFSRRAIDRKNRVLAERLAEAVKLKTETAAERNALSAEDTSAVEEQRTPGPCNPDEMSDEQLFDYLSGVIRSEKLYTDPSFGRQTLMDRFHLSDRRIGAAFAQGSQYASISEFIRELRLDHACQMLTERTDVNISDIAIASGFNSPIVFSRAFKAKYEITPSYYRSQMVLMGA